MAAWDVIDVTVIGGPDVRAARRSAPAPGGRLLEIELSASASMPARVERVGVVLASETVDRWVAFGPLGRSPVSPGPGRARPGRPAAGEPAAGGPVSRGAVSTGVLLTDRGTVGWLGAGAHAGRVELQRDGWLVTAWADLGGIVLGPAESLALDPLWTGEPSGRPDAAAYAAAWSAAVRGGPGRPFPHRLGWWEEAPGAVAPVAASLVSRGFTLAVLDGRLGTPRDETVTAATDAGLHCGVRIDLGRPGTRPDRGWGGPIADLTRPGVVEGLEAWGASLGEHFDVVVVEGGGDPSAPGAAGGWGDAASTPHRARRDALAALRRGLGPGAFIHLVDAPLGVGAGVADLLEVSAPLTVGARAATATATATATARWQAALGAGTWLPAAGCITLPSEPAPGPAALDDLARAVALVSVAGDPGAWGPAGDVALSRWADSGPAG